MSFRSRPVLDRRHRPRWQDELRTQQLTIVAFAVAIALALGIFGATAWNGYWESHFRPVASVGDVTFDRADLTERQGILVAQLIAQATELQEQISGGPRDQLLQQQLEAINGQLNGIAATSAQSLIDHAVLAQRAADFGLTVSDAQVDASVAQRYALPERVQANLIVVDFLPGDAAPDATPTDEQKAAAMAAAQAARERIEAGEEFAAVATDVSDDATAATGGGIGWFQAGDRLYGDYFRALDGASAGDLVGPIETERGAAVLQLVARRAATTEGGLRDVLRDGDVAEADFRAFVRGELLRDAYRSYFEDVVVVSPAPQRSVAQIMIAPVSGAIVPQERARHVLIQPDPDIENQADASDEQWAAALEEARQVEDLVRAPDADWWAIAEDHSDDPGSASRGGDLGWYDPANMQFVRPFAAELEALDVGEISEPIRTDFGYHVIQKTGDRDSPAAEADGLVAQLRADPDAFADVAMQWSEDSATAKAGGELGWVARYQLSQPLEEAVFGLAEVGEISDVVDAGSEGFYIFKLLETAESREVEEDRLAQIRSSGFARWLDEDVRAGVDSWIDPELAPAAPTGAS